MPRGKLSESALSAVVYHALQAGEPLSSAQLQRITRKSQPTVSRALAALADRVATLGRARATRYGAKKSIHSLLASQPLYWFSETGRPWEIGHITLLANDYLHVETESFSTLTHRTLPWYMAPLRLDGFLGRLQARHLGDKTWEADPARWTLEQVLYAATGLYDAPGALLLGDRSQPDVLPVLPDGKAGASVMTAALDHLANTVAQTLPAGSSAGGEQPKLLARLADETAALVKFSPPRGTPFGDRWRDLLIAEHLAGQILRKHDVVDRPIAVATTHLVESDARTYLVSERFDRVSLGGLSDGRRHVVSILAAHEGLVGGAYPGWDGAALALMDRGRLSFEDQAVARALLQFGRLIGNTDMHGGNLSLFVEPETVQDGLLALAPVYDMLPMRWRPTAEGAPDYTPFDFDARDAGSPLAGAARDFWAALQESDVSPSLKVVAAEMARRIGDVVAEIPPTNGRDRARPRGG